MAERRRAVLTVVAKGKDLTISTPLPGGLGTTHPAGHRWRVLHFSWLGAAPDTSGGDKSEPATKIGAVHLNRVADQMPLAGRTGRHFSLPPP